jgi:hypothetical protein
MPKFVLQGSVPGCKSQSSKRFAVKPLHSGKRSHPRLDLGLEGGLLYNLLYTLPRGVACEKRPSRVLRNEQEYILFQAALKFSF